MGTNAKSNEGREAMRTIIKGGTLVYGSGVKQEDMLIANGKIEAIKQTIHPTGQEQMIDGTSYYVLPGFITSVDSSVELGYEHGITTFVRSSVGIELEEVDHAQFNLYDYVYRVALNKLNKNILQDLFLNQVKVIKLDSALLRQMDWALWLPRLKRYGIVLEMEEKDYPELRYRDIPMILPFGDVKPMASPRTVWRITDKQLSKWEKTAHKWDPFVLSGFWTDVVEYPIPRLVENQTVPFLMRLVKTRSSIPAKVFGVFPQKGSLRIGADADFLLVSKEDMKNQNGTLFKPSQTWIRGVCCGPKEHRNENGRQLPCHLTYAFTY